jgi:hypothetical protein
MAQPNNDKWAEIGYTIRVVAGLAFVAYLTYLYFR